MNVNSAISIIESVEGFCDESTPCGEAWSFILRILNQDAQPTAQPTETCKWKRDGVLYVRNPHDNWDWNINTITYCPTCGKRIEVV